LEDIKKPLGLYIHIPFCVHKCDYCDFCSVDSADKKEKARYAEALCLNISDTGPALEKHRVDTIYFGGGTPTSLTRKLIYDIFDTIYENIDIHQSAEITFEANPATITKDLARTLVDCGVNRLSLGLQSTVEDELKTLTRIHTLKDFMNSYEIARREGFTNINIDLMYGIPGQTKASFLSSLEYVIGLDPEHISAYSLKIEDGTPFALRRPALPLPDEETQYEMYMASIKELSQAGYSHYEISNFAKPGCMCEHNLKYWNMDEYIGLGVSAASYFGGERYLYTRDIGKYMEINESGENLQSLFEERKKQSKEDEENDFVMLAFRLADGVNKAAYRERFGVSFNAKYGARLSSFIEQGFVIDNAASSSLTDEGMFVSNYILSTILDL